METPETLFEKGHHRLHVCSDGQYQGHFVLESCRCAEIKKTEKRIRDKNLLAFAIEGINLVYAEKQLEFAEKHLIGKSVHVDRGTDIVCNPWNKKGDIVEINVSRVDMPLRAQQRENGYLVILVSNYADFRELVTLTFGSRVYIQE